MQSLLILKPRDDADPDRIINIDLMSTACVSSTNSEWTQVICGYADITLHIPFSEFLKQVQHLIAENYRVSAETSVQWHKKRMADMEAAMKAAINEHKN